jgi:stearoyl-CoA desaturase (delta-9 desaturase)
MAPKILESSSNGQNGESISTRARTSHKPDDEHEKGKENEVTFEPQIRWPDLLAQLSLHIGFLCGLYYLIALKAKFYTYVWCEFSRIDN